MVWNKSRECISRDEMLEIQSKRLVNTVKRVYYNVPYYREKMQNMNLEPGDIKGLEDIGKLPFMTKSDLRETYPYGLFATDLSSIVRIHASSGTTGKQTVVGYTRKDIDIWAECMARSMYGAGADNKSVIQVSYGYGLFTGGLGTHYGAELIGAAVVPTSSGNTKRQIQIIADFGTTHLACTPSYALYIAETMEEIGVTREDTKLRVGLFGAEPWTENMRNEIEERLGIDALDIYGLSEIMGPAVSCECLEKTGMHIQEDHFIPEILCPQTLEPLPDGDSGELVVTTVTKEGMPLIRYRTSDITSLDHGVCACGRTSVRMKRVTGRTDDMLIIRGVNVFPSQIEGVLLELGDASPHYQILVDRQGNLDYLEIQVEMTPHLFSDEVRSIERIEKRITTELQSILNLSAKVRLVEPKSITRSEGKARRVIDKRVMR